MKRVDPGDLVHLLALHAQALEPDGEERHYLKLPETDFSGMDLSGAELGQRNRQVGGQRRLAVFRLQ